MKIALFGIILGLLAVLVSSCGGGGGGGGTAAGTATLIGRILSVDSGGATNPQSSVQVGTTSVLTSATDGSFTLAVPAGTASVTVDTRSASGLWTFAIAAPVAGATLDVGDLWVGPTKITLNGRLVDSATSNGIVGATVAFAGRTATSGANGGFSIPNVAYPQASLAAFFGIVGKVNATGYFSNTFSAAPNAAISGVVTINDVLLTPLSSSTPPPAPYNIWGRISPTAIAGGTTVTLKQAGTAVRVTNADGAGNYYFWIVPGTYTISYVNGAHTSPDQSVTVASTSDVQRRDVTLN